MEMTTYFFAFQYSRQQTQGEFCETTAFANHHTLQKNELTWTTTKPVGAHAHFLAQNL